MRVTLHDGLGNEDDFAVGLSDDGHHISGLENDDDLLMV